MRKNEFLVLIIILVLLPLSGCLGGSDETENQTETTIINHYHYNNTTIIHQSNDSSQNGNPTGDMDNHYNNTTYVDNFYTNNTYVDNHYTNHSNHTNYSDVVTILYSQGGYWNGGDPTVFTLNTAEGELVQILEASRISHSSNGPSKRLIEINTDCGPSGNGNGRISFVTHVGTDYIPGETNLVPFPLPQYLPGSSMNCTHTFDVSGQNTWSLVYTIQSVSVI